MRNVFGKFRLGPVYENNLDARIYIKKILALKLLPAEAIAQEFENLKATLSPSLRSLFRRFNDYFYRQWVLQNNFSVFGLPNRTGNEVESWNSILLDTLGKHPYPWSYLGECLFSINIFQIIPQIIFKFFLLKK